MIEEILTDTLVAGDLDSALILRFFNPIGAHPSGMIGEVTKGSPNNLLPYISQVLVGKRDFLSVFGNDYETKDGTGVRDYIHVEDLAEGHISCLRFLEEQKFVVGLKIYNLGTGVGYSVLEIVAAMEEASGKTVPLNITTRRPGDIASCYADASLAKSELKWEAKLDLCRMCADTWNFQSKNPSGFE